jgi:radical SAM superfamily enzyme YgiQ (UPF0313 family)
MKVLLINAPRINSIWCGVPDIFNGKDQHLFPPLGIMYLSAWLKKHTDHEVMIVDPNADLLGFAAIEKRIREFGPDIVGITAMTHNLIDVHQCAEVTKRVDPGIHVTVGGPHAVSFPEEAIRLPHVDSIVIDRDAEVTFGEWVDALAGRRPRHEVAGVYYHEPDGTVVRNPARPILKDLSHLPYPDRSGVDLTQYYTPGMTGMVATTMATTRGCPQGCKFCLSTSAFSTRTPEDVVDEMEHCLGMGIQEVQFVDDIFNAPASRVVAISDEILRRGIKMAWGYKATVNATTYASLERAKEAGCTKGHFGVETGTVEGLQALGKTFVKLEHVRQVFKWCRELDLTSCAYIMIGTPVERSQDDIYRTIEFVNELDPDYVVYAITSPYPHTPLWKEGARLGLWDEGVWSDFMRNPTPELAARIPTVWTQHMSKDELLRIFKEVNRKFYFNPRKVLRTLARVSNLKEVQRIAQGGLAIAKLQLMNAAGRRI